MVQAVDTNGIRMLYIVSVFQGLAKKRGAEGDVGDGLLVAGRNETIGAECLGGKVIRSLEVLGFQLGDGNLGAVGQFEGLGTGGVGGVGGPGGNAAGIAEPVVALGLGSAIDGGVAGCVIHPYIHHLRGRRRSGLQTEDAGRSLAVKRLAGTFPVALIDFDGDSGAFFGFPCSPVGIRGLGCDTGLITVCVNLPVGFLIRARSGSQLILSTGRGTI